MKVKYLMRLSDGFIFPYSEALAKRADKFEEVILKKVPSSGRIDVVAYHRRMQQMEERKKKAAMKEIEKAAAQASEDKSSEDENKE
jgi:hypothetical protein